MSNVGRGTSYGQVLTWQGNYFTWAAPGGASLDGYTESANRYSTVLGVGARSLLATGYYNCVFGYAAGASMSGGGRDSVFGKDAGYYLTTGNDDVLLGWEAGYYIGGGSQNVAIGSQAQKGAFGYTPYGNVSVGYQSGYSLRGTVDGYNTLLGCQSGYNLTTAIRCICIGYNTTASGITSSYEIVIGDYQTGKGIGTTVIGKVSGTGVTTDTWLRGSTFHFGNETAGEKRWYFQNGASGAQPGVRWSGTAMEYSNGSDVWSAIGGGGGGGSEITVTAGMALFANQPVVIEQDRTGATTNLMAYYVDTGTWTSYGWERPTTYASWRTVGATALTGVYQYDACSLTATVGVVAWVEGTDLIVLPFQTTYNPATGLWNQPTVGVNATVYSGTAPSDVSITAVTATKFVVSCIDGAVGKLVCCEYSDMVTPPAFGATLSSGDTDVYSQVVEYNFTYTTTHKIACVFGKSSTNQGRIRNCYVSTTPGTLTLNWHSLSSSYFGGATTLAPKCLTVARLHERLNDSLGGPWYGAIGVLYGDTSRGIDRFYSDSGGSTEHAYDQVGSINQAVWRIDEEIVGAGTIGGIMDGATAAPGFGAFLSDSSYVNIVRATSFSNRMAVLTGQAGDIPVPNRAQILPVSTLNEWGLRSVMITPMGRDTFIYSGRQMKSLTYAERVVFGMGRVVNGVVTLSTAGDIAGGVSGVNNMNITPGTQEYMRFIPVRMSSTHFVAVGSSTTANFSTDRSWIISVGCDDRPAVVGIVQAGVLAGFPVTIATGGGISTAHTALVPGATYYLSGQSTTGVGYYSTKPTAYPIGVALSATDMYLFPRSEFGGQYYGHGA